MNETQKISGKLKYILKNLGVEYYKIIIFGSRARGDLCDDESDWDILIILKETCDKKAKIILWEKIYAKIHEYFPFISIDIILKDKSSFDKEKEIVNTISNEAVLEGVSI